jgi:hypothetical protein
MLLIVIVGAADPVTTRVTAMDCGEFDAPAAVTVTVP